VAYVRFLLGAGESANWPAATKAVSEWFPKHERGWAVALFDSGSSVGGAIAPALVVWLYLHFRSWRPAFLIIGALGFFWLIGWRRFHYPPQCHPRISQAEKEMILSDKLDVEHAATCFFQARSIRTFGFRPPHRWLASWI
jgi:ACS family hexuronate transporter-like MFS transporter